MPSVPAIQIGGVSIMEIKEGQIIFFDEGQYTDYRVIAICKVKVDFDTEVMLNEYLEANPALKERYEFYGCQFVKWLEVDKQLIDTIETVNWY